MPAAAVAAGATEKPSVNFSAKEHSELYRFHVPDLSGDRLTLPAAEAHHAANVLRLGPGSPVELFDGRGGAAAARIGEVRRGEVTAIVESRRPPRERPSPEVHLAFAVPKGKRLDWLLEKATELGAASLRPIVFARSVAGGEELSAAAEERWRGHCVAAAKQSGLNFLPEVCQPAALADFLAAAPAEWLKIVGHPGAAAVPLPAALEGWRERRPLCVLVGPEGGLAEGELTAIDAAGFLRARLGENVLRIETAALALLAAVTAVCVRPEHPA